MKWIQYKLPSFRNETNTQGIVLSHSLKWFYLRSIYIKIGALILCLSLAAQSFAQDDAPKKALEVYGFAMTDMGYDFKQIDPRWFDALRINRLPRYKDQFAPDGKTFFGVRQTRFGVAGYTPTPMGDLKVVY